MYRIGLPRAAEGGGLETLQAMIAQLQPRMLTGDEQVGRLAEGGECMGNRAELDGFRARSNNERNAILAQLTPWLRRCGCRRIGPS